MTGTLWLFAAKLCIAKLHTTCQHSLGPLICISTHPWVTDLQNFLAKPFTACQHTALRSLICISTHPWVTDLQNFVAKPFTACQHTALRSLICISTHPWVTDFENFVAKPFTACQHTALRSLICVSTHPWVTDMETYVVPENANVKYILWVFAANSCVAKPRTASQHLNTLLDHALIWKALSCFNTPMSEKTCLLLFCRFDINKGIMWTGVALMASRSVHHSFYNSYITLIHFLIPSGNYADRGCAHGIQVSS